MLEPHIAKSLGSVYSDENFDLIRLWPLRNNMLEIGRACVLDGYRSGSTILLLWSALAKFMTEKNYDHLIGCSSVGLADGGKNGKRLPSLEQKINRPNRVQRPSPQSISF